jgi:hypothetical protein
MVGAAVDRVDIWDLSGDSAINDTSRKCCNGPTLLRSVANRYGKLGHCLA